MRRHSILVCAVLVFAFFARADEDLFESFKAKYNKKYADSVEEAHRRDIFQENVLRAAEMQSQEPLARFGINEFSDVSADEFAARQGAGRFFASHHMHNLEAPTPVLSAGEAQTLMNNLGSTIDWRTKGAVTPVRNQGACEGSWAFSAVGAIEGQWFLAKKTLVQLSEQDLLSCDTIDSGCKGGLMSNAFSWLMQKRAGQIVSAASYPFASTTGTTPACAASGKAVGAVISGQKALPQDETQMAAWLASMGPFSVGVDSTSWQSYTGGIMTNCRSVSVDHGTLVVGMGVSGTTNYWVLKNSWGTAWGESGYIRVAMGSNQCLITSFPTAVTVAGGPTMPPTAAPTPAPTTLAPTPAPTTMAPTPAPSSGPGNCTATVSQTSSGVMTTTVCTTSTTYKFSC